MREVKDKKVTVIVPVYNTGKYLRRCLDSVLNQTYRNIEVVIVDDGSTDDSPAICDEYAKKDNRIRVIHKKNGGLSSARNAALDSNPQGDYITFIDSDDWIAQDTYEYAIRLLCQKDADVLQYDYTLATDNNIFKENPKTEICHEWTGKGILQYYLSSSTKTGSYSSCRCVFAKYLTDGIRFREGKVNEDIDWKYKVLRRAKKLIDSNQVKYYYYQSGSSLSSGPLKQRDFQLREAADLLEEMTAEETYGTIAFLGRVKKARTAFSLLCRIAYFGIEDTRIDKYDTIRSLTSEHRKNLGVLLKAPLPVSRKVLCVMFAISYSLTEKLIHLGKHL